MISTELGSPFLNSKRVREGKDVTETWMNQAKDKDFKEFFENQNKQEPKLLIEGKPATKENVEEFFNRKENRPNEETVEEHIKRLHKKGCGKDVDCYGYLNKDGGWKCGEEYLGEENILCKKCKEENNHKNNSPNLDVKYLSVSEVKKENKQATFRGEAIPRQSGDTESLTSSGDTISEQDVPKLKTLYLCIGCRQVHCDSDYSKEDGDLEITNKQKFFESISILEPLTKTKECKEQNKGEGRMNQAEWAIPRLEENQKVFQITLEELSERKKLNELSYPESIEISNNFIIPYKENISMIKKILNNIEKNLNRYKQGRLVRILVQAKDSGIIKERQDKLWVHLKKLRAIREKRYSLGKEKKE